MCMKLDNSKGKEFTDIFSWDLLAIKKQHFSQKKQIKFTICRKMTSTRCWEF